MARGTIVFEGSSAIDGSPIVAIATHRSANPKTGSMIQLWIIRQDVHPVVARAQGSDDAICGNCPHRSGSCYVELAKAPATVYRAYQAGRYTRDMGQLNRLLADGQAIRLGAYGDPAALPLSVISGICGRARRWTGYTHQWRTCDWRFSAYLMASADTADDAADASGMGWRYFRVSAGVEVGASEILCPASEEAGRLTTCDRCGLCSGTAGLQSRANDCASIYIPAHGQIAGARARHARAAGLTSITIGRT